MRQRFRSHDTDEIFFPLSRAGVAWEYIWDIGCSCCGDGGIEPGTQVDHVVPEPVQANHGAFVLGAATLELLQPAERLDPAHHRLFPFRCFSATNRLVLSCLSASIASVATGQSSSHPLSRIPSLLSRCGRIGDASALIGSRWGEGAIRAGAYGRTPLGPRKAGLVIRTTDATGRLKLMALPAESVVRLARAIGRSLPSTPPTGSVPTHRWTAWMEKRLRGWVCSPGGYLPHCRATRVARNFRLPSVLTGYRPCRTLSLFRMSSLTGIGEPFLGV